MAKLENELEVLEITPEELMKKREAKEDFVLLDIREEDERKLSKIGDDLFIPMSELGQRFNELPKNKEITVYCRSGARSYNVTTFLLRNKFNAMSLKGGIEAWQKIEKFQKKSADVEISRPVDQMGKEEIVKAVKLKYNEVATDPYGLFSFPVGKWFAEQVGYPKKILDKLPDSLTESFTGANNPQPFVDIKKGETVLDLGCGAGLDLYFYSKAAGPKGKAYGVDISEKMVSKAKDNMKKLGLTNVEIMHGRSDKIPLKDNSLDIVASNGVYNLSPYKEAAMKEVFRVLKPGGRNVFCEIMLKNPLFCDIKTDVSYWFRCIGGALAEQEFISLMKKVGFEKIKVISRGRNARTGHDLAIYANVRAYKPKVK